jgi:hypothetical protein
MSNSLAIATVTGTLVTRVTGLLNEAGLTGLEVSASHPTNDPKPGVYITLYQLNPNASLRNADLPTRRASGEPAQRPTFPLNLRYVFSFVGDADKFEAERLAGLVLADLHARPVLSAPEIDAFVNSLPDSHALRASDLAREAERVRLSPLSLDIEELSRVWGLFNQSFFALSSCWEASVVWLDGKVEPSIALPVATTGVTVLPVSRPALTRLYAEATHQPVVESSDTLVIEGSQLLGQRTRLVIGDASLDVGPAQLSEGKLRVPLAGVSGLSPGVHAVTIEQRVVVPGAAGTGERTSGVSNALAVMVRPSLGTLSVSGTGSTRSVHVVITPAPRAGQSLEISLEATDQSARRTSRNASISAAETVFEITGLSVGDWLVRVSVDGASSLPTMVGDRYAGPTVSVS